MKLSVPLDVRTDTNVHRYRYKYRDTNTLLCTERTKESVSGLRFILLFLFATFSSLFFLAVLCCNLC